MKKSVHKFKYDFWLLVPYLFLSLIGILMVYSSSANTSLVGTSQLGPAYYFQRQAEYFVAGLFLILFFSHLRFSILKKRLVTNGFLGLVTIGLAMLVFMRNHEVNGASAWLNIAGFQFQPSEFAKLAIILYLARMLSIRESQLIKQKISFIFLKVILAPLLVVGFIGFLVIIQPDTGGFLALLFISLAVVSISGISWLLGSSLFVFIILLFSGIISLISWLYHLHPHSNFPYQLRRIIAFVDPWHNSNSSGIQLTNSYFAINNGGWFGVGLGNSIQKNGYLPEANTDFILAIVSEELGIIVVILILLAIFTIIARATILAIRSHDNYSAMICIGVAMTFLVQTVFNVGGVSGLLPITGVTLPFISYGGSSVLLLSIELGLLFNVSNKDYWRRHELKNKNKK